ncbi:MAG: hypothetical protein HC915_13095 [Anaerolineae bacterium]|nr:hypothetical protein [Anaerolineae bacterium]
MLTLDALIKQHLARYPLMEVLDVYKLVHQGTFGIGHKVAKTAAEREWLQHEFKTSTADPTEPLLEVVSQDEQIARLNLRAYLAAGGALEALLDAYIASAAGAARTGAEMAATWDAFAQLTANSSLGQHFNPRDILHLGRIQREENDWSAMQHSPAYTRAYRPAYRVLVWAQAQQLLQRQNIAWPG